MATAVISPTKAAFLRYKKGRPETCVHITSKEMLDSWKYFDNVVRVGEWWMMSDILYILTLKKLKP